MKLILKSGATKKQIENIEKKLFKKRTSGGFDAKKYNGVLNLTKDSLIIQLKIRDEWEREIIFNH